MTGSPDEPLAIAGTRKSAKELADGTLRVQIDIEPRHKQAFHRAFPEIDMPVAIAPLNLGVIVDPDMKPGPIVQGNRPGDTLHAAGPAADKATGRLYGQQAKALRLSAFFRNPDVWKAIGSDSDYQSWIWHRPCIVCGYRDYSTDWPDGICESAHVRRAGESGTGYKAEYATVPMCHEDHACQHQHGELAVYKVAGCPLGDEGSQSGNERLAAMWFDRERIEHVSTWCWVTLKAELGYDSWAEIPPGNLLAWAEKHDLARFLPDCYREV